MLLVRQQGYRGFGCGLGGCAGFAGDKYAVGTAERVANDAFWAVAGREPTPGELAQWAAHPMAARLDGPQLRAAMTAAGVGKTAGGGSGGSGGSTTAGASSLPAWLLPAGIVAGALAVAGAGFFIIRRMRRAS